jgi:hypothetical protein
VGMLSYDRARVDGLRLGLGAALEDLRGIRNDDAAAADVMRALHGACKSLTDVWLPRVHDILNSTAMTSCIRSALGTPDLSQAAVFAAMHHDGWEIAPDPLEVLGPPAPHAKSFDEVLSEIKSGAMQPMLAPLDANGRANARYESLAFAPTSPPQLLGEMDLTSDAAKVVDFLSDGLPVGWHQTDTVGLYRLENVRVVQSVHRLTAYDREDGPETDNSLTTEATVSGFMMIAQNASVGEVTMEMQDEGDPSAHVTLASQSITEYSGAFYPDSAPQFHPIPTEPRFVSPAQWTFTTSASPMVDGWGTWQT